jgi:hypothetical protein
MEDMERYGDYNEIDESPSKNPVAIALKAVVLVVCFSVIGFLLFRIALFNYYPKSMLTLYFDEVLTEHYASVGGDMEVLTQELRFPYDDPNDGNFFCDSLFVIEAADQVQITLRFNTAIIELFKTEYGVDISELDSESVRITLARDPIEEKGDPITVAEVSETVGESLLMYRYYKLVFNGVDLGLDEGEDKIEWLRLEIELLGTKEKTSFAVPIYENNSGYSKFDTYRPSKGELPK